MQKWESCSCSVLDQASLWDISCSHGLVKWSQPAQRVANANRMLGLGSPCVSSPLVCQRSWPENISIMNYIVKCQKNKTKIIFKKSFIFIFLYKYMYCTCLYTHLCFVPSYATAVIYAGVSNLFLSLNWMLLYKFHLKTSNAFYTAWLIFVILIKTILITNLLIIIIIYFFNGLILKIQFNSWLGW